MFRRVTSAFAASAVVLSGLVWGAAPANASISNASITPSEWSPGSTAAATVTWTESSATSNNATSQRPWSNTLANTGEFLSVEVGWGWAMADANPANDPPDSYVAAWDPTAKSYTCATTPTITFSSPGFSNSGGAIECLIRRASNPQSPSDPGQQVILSNVAATPNRYFSLTTNSVITVTFASGQVTAPSTVGSSDTWRIISLVNAQTTTVRTTVTAVDSAGNPIPTVTLNIDSNGGQCNVTVVTGLQGSWTKAPDANSCFKSDGAFIGFNTKRDGSGTQVAPGGNLNLTFDNTLFAQYETLRVAGAPTNVVATGGSKSVKVSWTAPADPGSTAIAAYLVQATPGGNTCVTNQASANMLECTYTNLVPGTKYTFKVQALNRAGWGEFSAVSNEASPYNVLLDSVSRPEQKFLFVSRGSRLEAEGRAPGLDAGTVLTPVMRIGADGAFVPLAKDTTKVDRDGRFSWSRKIDRRDNGKPVSLFFTYGDANTATLTAKLGATIGLPSKPRDVKVTSTIDGITVSWNPPAKDGGSPVTGYEMKSDLRAPGGARSKFVSCKVAAPTTTCTMRAGVAFDPNKTYTFSVVAKTERGTSREATQTWKGEVYRLNIYRKVRTDSDIQLSFTASGWSNPSQAFEVQAKVGANGAWKKQGTARLNPDFVQSAGDWEGKLPKSATAGSEVFYRLKSNRGLSNEVSFRLSSDYQYSAD